MIIIKMSDVLCQCELTEQLIMEATFIMLSSHECYSVYGVDTIRDLVFFSITNVKRPINVFSHLKE